MLDFDMPFYYIPEWDGGCSLEELLPRCTEETRLDTEHYHLVGLVEDIYEDSFSGRIDWKEVVVLSQQQILQNFGYYAKYDEWRAKEYEKEIKMIQDLPPNGVFVCNLNILDETPEITPWIDSLCYLSFSSLYMEEYGTEEYGVWRTYVRVPENGGDEDWCGLLRVSSFQDDKKEESIELLERITYCGYGLYPYLIRRLDGSNLYLYTFTIWHA